MPNKHRTERENWISIVITMAFILGFFLLQGGITGLVTLEPVDVVTFEVNSVIPATATLEIISGTQSVQQNLSEFTIKLSDLASIQPILENNTLIAYNITNITIDLTNYNIEPADSVTIRFLEIYKEITRESVTQEITKEENITKEVIAVTENITELVVQPEITENITLPEQVAEENITTEPVTTENITLPEFTTQYLGPSTSFAYYLLNTSTSYLINGGVTTKYTMNNTKGGTRQVMLLPKTAATYYYIYPTSQFVLVPDKMTWDVNLSSLNLNVYCNRTGATSAREHRVYVNASVYNPTTNTYTKLGEQIAGGTCTSGAAMTAYTQTLQLSNGNVPYGQRLSMYMWSWLEAAYSGSVAWGDTTYPSNLSGAWNTLEGKGNVTSSASTSSVNQGSSFTLSTNVTCNGGRCGNVSLYAMYNTTATPETWTVITGSTDINLSNGNANPFIGCNNMSDTLGTNENISCIYTWNLTGKTAGTYGLIVNMTWYNSSIYPLSNSTLGSLGLSSLVTVNAPNTAPTVQIFAPINNSYNLTHLTSFTYTVTDSDAGNNGIIHNCSLWLQKAGVWQLNATNSTLITEGVNQTINISLGHESVNWTIECSDINELRVNATQGYYNYTVYDAVPTVYSVFPENNTYSLTHLTSFTYNVSSLDTVSNCSLWLQKAGIWSLNLTDTNIEKGINQSMNISLGHELINWTIQCTNTFSEYVNTSIRNYTVYDSTPVVYSVFPENNTYSLTHLTSFTYNVSSLDTVSNCSLWLQKAGIWSLNLTDTAIEKDTNQSLNVSLGHELVNWTIQCTSTYSEYVNTSIRNYTVYDSTPIVSLIFPANNTYQMGLSRTDFTYNVTSPDSSLTCDLYINNAWNSTDTAIEKGINQTFNLTFASYQNLNWSVGCNNSYNEYVNSTMYNYSLIEQQNVAPIIEPENVTPIQPTSITLDSYTLVSFTFLGCDADGTTGLVVHANMTGELNVSGDTNFFDANLSCEGTGWSNSTCLQYNCSFKMWYWYKAGSWNYSMNITDGTEWAHSSNNTNFQLASTTGIVVAPTSLSWTSLNAGATNQTSNNDPITINNTGNYNVSLSKINITAYNLRGETNTTQEIPANNFTASTVTGGTCSGADCIECYNSTTQGVQLLNATSLNILGSMLPRGNHSEGYYDGKTGWENITFCLRQVPVPNDMFGVQTYSTTNSVQWVIGVS